MYYLSSENKGADQLRGYRKADLRLCFRLCRLLVFPLGGSFVNENDVILPPICIVELVLYSIKPICGKDNYIETIDLPIRT